MKAADLNEISHALDINKGNTHKKAIREAWPVETRTVRGGSRNEYQLATLPEPARIAVETHRAQQHLAELEPTVLDWAKQKNIALTDEQQADKTVAGKLLCAMAMEAYSLPHTEDMFGNPPQPPFGKGGSELYSASHLYSLDAQAKALAARLQIDVLTVGRWTQEAQGWMDHANATMAQPVVVITHDERGEERFAEAWFRYQIITPALQHPKSSHGRAAAIKLLVGTTHTRPNGETIKLKAATLYNWLDLYAQNGMESLKPKTRSDKAEPRVSLSREFDKACTLPEADKQKVVDAVLLYIRSGWASGVSGWRDLLILSERHTIELCQLAGWEPGLEAPLLSRRVIESQRGYGIIAVKRADAKAYFDKFLPRIKRTAAFLKPMQIVVGDVHPLDIGIDQFDGTKANGTARFRRVYPRLIVWQDVATNRVHVTVFFARKGENVRREHIAQAFCAMVGEWGIPESLYLDNGGEYKWEEMMAAFTDLAKLTGKVRAEFLEFTQDREMVEEARMATVASRKSPPSPLLQRGESNEPPPNPPLVKGGIEKEGSPIHRARPYNAPAKPIEGLFSVLESTVFSMIPGWVGGDRMRKKTQNVGKEPAAFPGSEADLFKAISTAIAYYHRKPQTGGWLDGKCPVEQYNKHIAEGWQMITCRAEELMLSFADTYTPTANRGLVTINGVDYYHNQILPYTGQKLPVKVSRHDPGLAFVFDPKNSKLIAAAEPEKAYGLYDAAGAEEQGRRAKWLSRCIAEQAECCMRLDLVEEMRKVVNDGLAMGKAPKLAQIELSIEAKAMREALEDKQAEVQQDVLVNKAKPSLVSPWAVDDESDEYLKSLTFNEASV